jgi:arabinofuranosyltransferase
MKAKWSAIIFILLHQYGAVLLCCSILMLAIIRHAGVVEDAYISLRVVDNFTHGYGLRWNIDERVQAFTHPLWLLLHIPFALLLDNLFSINITLSLCCSFAAVVISLFALKRSQFILITLFLVPLIASPTFVTFSANGLENPLSHLLFALFGYTLLRITGPQQVFWLSLFFSLSVLNRMDTALLYIPALALMTKQHHINIANIRACILGSLPFICWEIFSLFYYGSLFPNTKYAKLATNIPLEMHIEQGFHYLLNLILFECTSALIIFLMIVIPIGAIFYNKPNKERYNCAALAIGILLYVIYIIGVGGTYVTGLFWSLPVFASVWLLTLYASRLSKTLITLLSMVIIAIRLCYPSPEQLIAHCKLCVAGNIAPISNWKVHLFNNKIPTPTVKRYSPSQVIVMNGAIGMKGYQAGPLVHIVDELALTDALLARLPSTYKVITRTGHIRRNIPQGYIHALKTGDTTEMSPTLAEYYSVLRQIISGNLYDWHRINLIIRFNLGLYDPLLTQYIEMQKNHLYK